MIFGLVARRFYRRTCIGLTYGAKSSNPLASSVRTRAFHYIVLSTTIWRSRDLRASTLISITIHGEDPIGSSHLA